MPEGMAPISELTPGPRTWTPRGSPALRLPVAGQHREAMVLGAHSILANEVPDETAALFTMVGLVTSLMFLAEELGIDFEAVLNDARLNHDSMLSEPHPEEDPDDATNATPSKPSRAATSTPGSVRMARS
jgi:hypothetical protein